MYSEAFNTWKEKFRAECMAEGRAMGIAEGRAEGKAIGIAESKAKLIGELQKAVRNALECHFAPLPPSAGEDIKILISFRICWFRSGRSKRSRKLWVR